MVKEEAESLNRTISQTNDLVEQSSAKSDFYFRRIIAVPGLIHGACMVAIGNAMLKGGLPIEEAWWLFRYFFWGGSFAMLAYVLQRNAHIVETNVYHKMRYEMIKQRSAQMDWFEASEEVMKAQSAHEKWIDKGPRKAMDSSAGELAVAVMENATRRDIDEDYRKEIHEAVKTLDAAKSAYELNRDTTNDNLVDIKKTLKRKEIYKWSSIISTAVSIGFITALIGWGDPTILFPEDAIDAGNNTVKIISN